MTTNLSDPRYASIISGIPGHEIEDVKLSNIRIYYQGGGARAQSELQPPERETNYPEPSMFGDMPSYGFFIRHTRNISLSNVVVSYLLEDQRPAFAMNHVQGAEFFNVKAQHAVNVSVFALQNVSDFSSYHCSGVPDMRLEKVDQRKF